RRAGGPGGAVGGRGHAPLARRHLRVRLRCADRGVEGEAGISVACTRMLTDPLFDPAVVEDPHGYYAHRRQPDPAHHVPGPTAFLVSRMDLIHAVVAQPAAYSSVSTVFLHEHATDADPGLRAARPES